MMIRVFPRKTKWSPNDDLAFFDEPPLFKLPKMDVMESTTTQMGKTCDLQEFEEK